MRPIPRRPSERAQLELFRSLPGDLAPRDAQDLMAYPFFSLSKSPRTRPIDFAMGGVEIRVEAVPDHGVATIWDADILIWAASQIVEARDAGLRTSRLMAATPYEILTFIGRGTSARDYQRLKAALDRLQSTTICTTLRQPQAGRRRVPMRHVQFLRAAWDDVRTSFWFVPTLMAIGGAILASIAPALDAWAEERAPFAFVITREDALQLLGTILTSMITMTSLVFSITMVVLTLAASQFGPRLIRTYMARRQTQVILGTFAMTIVFCLLLIARIGQAEGPAASAPAAIPAAVGLTLVSVMMLILHIHLLARSMLSETIIELVGSELDDGIAKLEHPRDGAGDEDPAAALPGNFEDGARVLGLRRQGYVQAIDFAALVETAETADILIGFRFRAGDYLIAGGRQIGIHPEARATEDLLKRVRRAFTLGPHRTPVQDVGFSLRHLVEIAARALSPGVNDPFTAAAVVDRLSGSLSRLMAARLPTGVFRDTAGRIRVVCEQPTHASLVSAAFDQIRQNGADKPLVLIHLARSVGRIADVLRTQDQARALRDQLRLIAETAEASVGNGDDRAAVARAIGIAADALDGAEYRLSQVP